MADRIKITRLTLAICASASLAGCGEEPPPPTVAELMENPVLLDATIVRCVQTRESTKYDAECVNARDAAGRLAVVAEETRREELEAQSERKRQALRQARARADEANRRAMEMARLRQEAEYLGLIGTNPETQAGNDVLATESSTPAESDTDYEAAALVTVKDLTLPPEALPADPAASMPAREAPSNTADLEAVREELQQRQQDPPQQTGE